MTTDELHAALVAATTRAEKAEEQLRGTVPRDTVGAIVATLQAAQQRTVETMQAERAANLYTADEARAILGAFAARGVADLDEATAAARLSVARAMREQQRAVFDIYAADFPELAE
jgi:hypothetical protein